MEHLVKIITQHDRKRSQQFYAPVDFIHFIVQKSNERSCAEGQKNSSKVIDQITFFTDIKMPISKDEGQTQVLI